MWGNVMLSRTEEVPLFKRTGPMGSGGKTCIPFRVRYEGLAAAGDPITSGDEELKQPKAKTEKELRGIEREEERKNPNAINPSNLPISHAIDSYIKLRARELGTDQQEE